MTNATQVLDALKSNDRNYAERNMDSGLTYVTVLTDNGFRRHWVPTDVFKEVRPMLECTLDTMGTKYFDLRDEYRNA